MPGSAVPTLHFISEQAIALHFAQVIGPDNLQQIKAVDEYIRSHPFPGFLITIPAYATLTIFYDPFKVAAADMPGLGSFEKVYHYLNGIPYHKIKTSGKQADRINIPVCYDERFAPDIAELAKLHKLDTAEVVKLHSEAVYKVYMIGFIPGFAYLGGMNGKLDTPRKANPRKAVPAGSVGIAGLQTGIYPLETPGGWQIIGRTPLKMFDAERELPSILKAGDEVIFKPIAFDEFDHLVNNK